jgi:prepilin-type N-terminal cleavage/methylation domain-containing protein
VNIFEAVFTERDRQGDIWRIAVTWFESRIVRVRWRLRYYPGTKVYVKTFPIVTWYNKGQDKPDKDTKGFTLIELMLIVTIIGILAAIAVPQLSGLIRKTQEAATKSNLGALRAAISHYMVDNDGRYPADNLQSLVDGGYINKIPNVRTPPYHPGGNVVEGGSVSGWAASPAHWYYFNNPNEPMWYGHIVVNCSHPDLKGKPWDEN